MVLQKRGGNSVLDDARALRSHKKKVLHAVAAQEKEFVPRADHQRLDDAQSFLPGGPDDAGDAEAPRGEPRHAKKAADEKQRCEIPSKIENIHGRHSKRVTLSGS